MNKNIAILRGPIGPLMMEASRVADDVQIMFDALSEAKLLLDSGLAGEANRRISVALMAVDRQPHTHMTCGFCLQPKIIRSKPYETKSGQPICDDCLEEYNRCFPLTQVNYLSIIRPSTQQTGVTKMQVNQIVKGVVCGTFVILALRTVDGEEGAQVKPVNPANHAEVGYGEFFLPISSLKALA